NDADTVVAVSPDGIHIAVTRDVLQKGESRLLVTGRDGARERVLATLPLPEGARSPAWSPDGKKIAVTHGRGIVLIDAASGAKTSPGRATAASSTPPPPPARSTSGSPTPTARRRGSSRTTRGRSRTRSLPRTAPRSSTRRTSAASARSGG